MSGSLKNASRNYDDDDECNGTLKTFPFIATRKSKEAE